MMRLASPGPLACARIVLAELIRVLPSNARSRPEREPRALEREAWQGGHCAPRAEASLNPIAVLSELMFVAREAGLPVCPVSALLPPPAPYRLMAVDIE